MYRPIIIVLGFVTPFLLYSMDPYKLWVAVVGMPYGAWIKKQALIVDKTSGLKKESTVILVTRQESTPSYTKEEQRNDKH